MPPLTLRPAPPRSRNCTNGSPALLWISLPLWNHPRLANLLQIVGRSTHVQILHTDSEHSFKLLHVSVDIFYQA